MKIVKFFLRILVSVAVVLTALSSCSNSEEVNFGLIREQAQKTSEACDKYFESVTNFASSGGDIASQTTLETNLLKLVDELSLMYSTVITSVSKDVALSQLDEAGNEDFEKFLSFSNFSKFSEAETEKFLTVTVQTECSKWSKFVGYSDSQITSYYSVESTDVDSLAEQVCGAARKAVNVIKTQKPIEIKKCYLYEDNESGPLLSWLVIELNDWIEWMEIDPNNIVDAQELDRYIFDYPLELVLKGSKDSGVKPTRFSQVQIVFYDDDKSLYEIAPGDIESALNDTRSVEMVLGELRGKIKIYSWEN